MTLSRLCNFEYHLRKNDIADTDDLLSGTITSSDGCTVFSKCYLFSRIISQKARKARAKSHNK